MLWNLLAALALAIPSTTGRIVNNLCPIGVGFAYRDCSLEATTAQDGFPASSGRLNG